MKMPKMEEGKTVENRKQQFTQKCRNQKTCRKFPIDVLRFIYVSNSFQKKILRIV
jgi:hypothetical protein